MKTVTLALSFVILAAESFQIPSYPEVDKLGFLVGKWSGPGKIAPPGSAPIEGPTTWTVTKDMGGRYLRIELSQEIAGMGTVRGMTMLGWDAGEKKYRSFTYTNSPMDKLEGRQETGVLHGKSLTMDATKDSPFPYRQVFEALPDGTLRYAMEFSINGKLTPVASGVLKRG